MPSWRRGGVVQWLGLAALMALGALLGVLAPPHVLDWQPALALRQPWRWFSAVGVHYSAAHLGVNLLGAALVAGLGAVVRIPVPMVFAWALAWPLTHLALLGQPDLTHYGGLSGVLHAGVAVVAVHLVREGVPAQRGIGALMAALLVAKVANEAPFGVPVFHPGLNIMVAPLAHATGVLAGVGCALLCGTIGAACARRRAARAGPTSTAPR